MLLHFDPILAKRILANALSPNVTPQQGGALLERLLDYILSTQGDFLPQLNVNSIDGQTDILVRNLDTSNMVLRELGTYLLLEAKRWNKRATSRVVKSFVTNIRSASCHTGILVALEGVTGSFTGKAAEYTIRKFYYRDNVVIVVLDRDHIEGLVNGRYSIVSLLIDRYERIRFERS